jgi:hypothetical protein
VHRFDDIQFADNLIVLIMGDQEQIGSFLKRCHFDVDMHAKVVRIWSNLQHFNLDLISRLGDMVLIEKEGIHNADYKAI